MVRESVSRSELDRATDSKVLSVLLIDGTIVTFTPEGGRYIERIGESQLYRSIVGVTTAGKVIEIHPDSTLEIQTEREVANVPATVLLVILGVAATVGGFFLLLALSFWAGH